MKNAVTAPIDRANYYEAAPEVNVYSWSPDPPGTPNARSTQVHLHLGKAPGNVFIVRLKSASVVDALIEALRLHRESVWGAAPPEPPR